MYSEKIKDSKIETMAQMEVDSAKIFNELDNFCTADDLIGASCDAAMRLFEEYCSENKKDITVSYTKFGIAIRKKFGLKTKSVRVGEKITRIYWRV